MALRGAALAACIGRRSRSSSMVPVPAYILRKNHNPASHNIIHTDGILAYPWASSGFTYRTKAMQGATGETFAPNNDSDVEQQNQNWKIKMLYDGDCPLCMREVNMLKERNKEYGTINFVDISSDKYSPEENQGLDYETVMGRIHGILSDGTVVTDVEAFRKLYEAVGLGWVYAVTKYEPIATVVDAVYGVWAKYRLQITGRPPLEEVLEARRKSKEEVCKDSSSCKM